MSLLAAANRNPDLCHDVPHLSSSEEVIEFRLSVQIFLQTEDPLGLYDQADFAVGIEEIAELAGSDRADLDAFGVYPFSDSLNAKSALFHHIAHSRTIPQIVGFGVHLIAWEYQGR